MNSHDHTKMVYDGTPIETLQEGISEGFHLAQSERAVPGGAGGKGSAPAGKLITTFCSHQTPITFATHRYIAGH